MPRNPRKSLNTSFFHVMTQGIERKFIFDNEQDIKYYIKLMFKFSKIENIKIVAYCIMNNHAHFLIKANVINDLSKFMQRLNMSYGKYYNTKYNRVGFVFRDRFKSEGIYSEKQFYTCINYIYNNPVKAGICLDPAQYPFSNYKKINFTCDEVYDFIEVENSVEEEKILQKIVDDFLKEQNITMENLKKDSIRLKKLIDLLKVQKVSLRKIAKILNISREKVRITNLK